MSSVYKYRYFSSLSAPRTLRQWHLSDSGQSQAPYLHFETTPRSPRNPAESAHSASGQGREYLAAHCCANRWTSAPRTPVGTHPKDTGVYLGGIPLTRCGNDRLSKDSMCYNPPNRRTTHESVPIASRQVTGQIDAWMVRQTGSKEGRKFSASAR